MTTPELKEYLSMVVDVEKNVYLQEQAMNKLNGEIPTLGKPREICAPVMPARPTCALSSNTRKQSKDR